MSFRLLRARPTFHLAPLRGWAVAVMVLLSLSAPVNGAQPRQQEDEQFFAATGYRIHDEALWSYFRSRGGVQTFGYPVSNTFLLLGTRVQVFQRHVLQVQPNGGVTLLNLLDDGLLPITHLGGLTLPGPSDQIRTLAPEPTSPDYLDRVFALLALVVPDTWEGLPVNFGSAFRAVARCEDVFADAPCDEALLPGYALEIWGLPTSWPQRDPNNPSYVYQRFQRSVMHYSQTTGATEGLLLGDWFKSILIGADLPPDLWPLAERSRFFAQYHPPAPRGLARPDELPGTDLTGAFEAEVLTRGRALFERQSGASTGSATASDPSTPPEASHVEPLPGAPGTNEQPGEASTDPPVIDPPEDPNGALGPQAATPTPAAIGTSTSSPTPTLSPTPTPTRTPTLTRTPTPTRTPSPIPTATPTRTLTPTPTFTPLPTPTATPPPPPSISGFTPASGPDGGAICGEQLTVHGANYGSSSAAYGGQVRFDGILISSPVSWADGSIAFIIPTSVSRDRQQFDVLVTTSSGTAQTSYRARATCQ